MNFKPCNTDCLIDTVENGLCKCWNAQIQPQEPATETPDSTDDPTPENPLLIPAEQFWMEEADSI